MNKKRIVTLLAASLLISGCASMDIFTPYQRPEIKVAEAWPGLPANATAYDKADWWTIFQDAQLNQLIEEALAHNHDVAAATSRIAAAQARIIQTDAEHDPTLTASFVPSYSRSTQRGENPLPSSFHAKTRSYSARLDASYEIDLWGKLKGEDEAARADFLASQAARDTVRNLVSSEIARGYFNLVAMDAQIDILKKTRDTRQALVKLQQLRMQSGVSSDFEVQQAASELAAIDAQIPALSRDKIQQQTALAVLLGREPDAILQSTVDHGAPVRPLTQMVPAGLPSELLLRRPDLREAEEKLIAANARVGIARSAFYPSLSLTGYLGGESRSLADMFVGPARIFRFAAELTQPLFAKKRIGASVDQAKANEAELVANYRNAIANAFADVKNALTAQQYAKEVLAAETSHIGSLQKTFDLSKLRYDHGVSSQLELLDAERNLLQSTLNRVQAERDCQTAVVDLFKAMGGGWQTVATPDEAK